MNSLVRALRIGLIAFVVLLAGVAIAARCAGERETLPFEYEGFDE